MLPLSLFRSPTFRGAAFIGVLINIAFYGLIFVLSLFFQRAQGRSALETGLAFAPMTAIACTIMDLSGRSPPCAGSCGVLAQSLEIPLLLRRKKPMQRF